MVTGCATEQCVFGHAQKHQNSVIIIIITIIINNSAIFANRNRIALETKC